MDTETRGAKLTPHLTGHFKEQPFFLSEVNLSAMCELTVG